MRESGRPCARQAVKNWRMTFLFVAAQRRQLDLPVGLTGLRHSFASGAVNVGESLPMIDKLLGHTQVQTTARYAHLAADPVKSAADAVASSLSRRPGNTRPLLDWFAPSSPVMVCKTLRVFMMADAPDQAMTVRDVAGYLNVDEKTVYRLAKRGDLPGFKVAGTWRFKKLDLDNWIDLQKKAAQTKQ